MTEYDFSPEAYHRHLENMYTISKWIDRTEQHRSQFENAAALIVDEHPKRRRASRKWWARRPLPPPPPLHSHGIEMVYPLPHRHPSPSHSNPSDEFSYSSLPHLPGSMPSPPSYLIHSQSMHSHVPHTHDPHSLGRTEGQRSTRPGGCLPPALVRPLPPLPFGPGTRMMSPPASSGLGPGYLVAGT